MKILLIEDSKLQRIANERALAKSGYVVIHAGDGEEGLRVESREHSRSHPARYDVAQSVGARCSSRSQRRRARKIHPRHRVERTWSGNETKLLKEGAAAFFMKSEKSFENGSSALIQAVGRVLLSLEPRGYCIR
jgi:hypothetical protein